MNIRRLAKSLTPPILICIVKKLFGLQNQPLSIHTQLEIRPKITLKLHPESVGPMRMFVDQNVEMIQEFNNFLNLSANCHRLLDIGALHGVFSLAFTAGGNGKSALAVDASPYAFARLLYNIHANPTCRIATEECAISDSAGKLKMGFEWEHAVASSNSASFITVQKFTADDICEKHKFKPDAIKIDVEGHELAALKGLQKTLSENHPLIFLEIHPSRIVLSGGSMPELHQMISTFSYEIHSLENAVISKIDFCSRTEDFRTTLHPI